MAAPLLEVLDRRGIDAHEHLARQLTRRMVRSARLVLTATRGHRVEVVRLDPSAATRTFTLKEFARAASGITDRSIDRIAHAARLAAHNDVIDHDDDLADPYGRNLDAYELMVAEADLALAAIMPS